MTDQLLEIADELYALPQEEFTPARDAKAKEHKTERELAAAVKTVVKRWRPAFESWKLSLFKSQSGLGWDLAISGPRFRKIFTLNGPVDDLPGLVSAYIDAIFAQLSDPITNR